jgi:glycerol-3-phosphate dehydrogenase (NAD(P)+)
MTRHGSEVAVIGAGSWGTALAAQVARHGDRVRLWARDASLASTIAATRENPPYLPGVRLPAGVLATADHAEALHAADLVIVAVPSHFLRQTLAPMSSSVPPGAALLSATKGLEHGAAHVPAPRRAGT